MIEFSTRKDIEAPSDYVFRAASDFTAFERQALRRGIDVSRTSAPGPVGASTTWILKADWRNRHWTVDAGMEQFDPPSGYVVGGKTAGVDLTLTVDLIPLSRSFTRISVTIGVVPTTIKTRILVQSLRLVRGSINDRLDKRVAIFAADVEDRFRATV